MNTRTPTNIDHALRLEMLHAAHLPDGIPTHPAWTSPEDSGLFTALVERADGSLANRGAVMDGEDVVMHLISLRAFAKAGVVLARTSAFSRHPMQQASASALLATWVNRRALSVAVKERGHEALLPKYEQAVTDEAADVMPLWLFVENELQTHTKLGGEIEAFLIKQAQQFGGVGGQALLTWLHWFINGDDEVPLSVVGENFGLSCGGVHATRRRYGRYLTKVLENSPLRAQIEDAYEMFLMEKAG